MLYSPNPHEVYNACMTHRDTDIVINHIVLIIESEQAERASEHTAVPPLILVCIYMYICLKICILCVPHFMEK